MDFLNKGNKDKKLVLACKEGNEEKIKKYLNKKYTTNVNYKSKKSGDTPLHKAVNHGNVNHINMLLAESTISTNTQNNKEETPIFNALHKQGPDMITVVEALLKSGASLKLPNKLQQMPLHIAAKQGNTTLVKMFIAGGAEVDCADKDDNTALHFASEGGYAECVEALLSANAVLARNKAGLTPIQIASDKSHVHVLAVFDRFVGALPANAAETVTATATTAVPTAVPTMATETAAATVSVGSD